MTQNRLDMREKEEIWFSTVTKALTPTENSKKQKQSDYTKRLQNLVTQV